MTPQQCLAILLQTKSPTEILLSQSPHQNGVNWVFHDQATRQLRYVNVPYMESIGQQSANQSTHQPATQQTPNWVAQQAHQMPSAGLPMMPMSPQPTMMMNSANNASPQQMPAADQ